MLGRTHSIGTKVTSLTVVMLRRSGRTMKWQACSQATFGHPPPVAPCKGSADEGAAFALYSLDVTTLSFVVTGHH